MKITPSRYVLAAEILAIFFFHLVKIKQAEKHPTETVFTQTAKMITLPKPDLIKRTGFEYMLVNLIK
jgi:hypothetical protein